MLILGVCGITVGDCGEFLACVDGYGTSNFVLLWWLWHGVLYLGRLDASVPRSKRLLSDDRSNILVYMTGATEHFQNHVTLPSLQVMEEKDSLSSKMPRRFLTWSLEMPLSKCGRKGG